MEKEIKVKYGPMNLPNGRHPKPIIQACKALGRKLPKDAKCKYQPSKYIKKGILNGDLLELRIRLGKNFPKDIKYKELVKKFRAFKRKYKTQKNLKYTKTDLSVYFTDWLLFARNRGFTHNCYFDYELYNKEADVRDTFLNEGYRVRVHEACATDGHKAKLLNKAKFNKFFKKWVKRDWIDCSKCSFEDFEKFAAKHDKFFAKPVAGTGGEGIEVIEKNSDTLQNIFEKCKNKKMVLEDIIKPYPDVAKFNDSTLNTVRITTLLPLEGEPIIIFAAARFGRKGNVADNFHKGGVCAIIDINTGVIITDSINREHIRSPYHPDSHEKILGFQYPKWNEIKKAVCDAAKKIPEMRNIGWDVALNEKGEVEFVEGNGRPNFDISQSPDQLGKRYRYEPYLFEIEKSKGIEFNEYPEIDLNVLPYKSNYLKRGILKLIKIKLKLKK